MTRRAAPALIVLLIALPLFAQKDLKSRVDAASGSDKIKLAVEYTDDRTRAADRAFIQGKDEEALADLKNVAEYAQIASQTAIQTRKHQKETEIALRKIAFRLDNIKKARPYEDQAAVQSTIDAVLLAHDNVLNSEFEKK